MESSLETYILSLDDVENSNTVSRKVKSRQFIKYIKNKKPEKIGLPPIMAPMQCSSQMLSMNNYNLPVICYLLWK